MNSSSAKIIQHEHGSFMSDRDGVSIGSQFSPVFNDIVTFINCRKNGVLVGPDYGWYENGTKSWYNLWAADASGKLLKWSTWNRQGREKNSNSIEMCAICQDAIAYENSAMLPCSHTFHYNCIRESMNTSTKCPVCRNISVNANCPCNPFWLCRVVAKNVEQNCVLIADIFGNQMWIQKKFQIYLPGYATAPNMAGQKLIQRESKTLIDRSCHLIQYSNDLDACVIVGNVTSDLNIPEFQFRHKQFLINNQLVAHENLLQNVT